MRRPTEPIGALIWKIAVLYCEGIALWAMQRRALQGVRIATASCGCPAMTGEIRHPPRQNRFHAVSQWQREFGTSLAKIGASCNKLPCHCEARRTGCIPGWFLLPPRGNPPGNPYPPLPDEWPHPQGVLPAHTAICELLRSAAGPPFFALPLKKAWLQGQRPWSQILTSSGRICSRCTDPRWDSARGCPPGCCPGSSSRRRCSGARTAARCRQCTCWHGSS